ncbi:MAG: transcriptional regulator BetI [Pseudomonadota bacterium]|nr:transcriptional regulator BetI [Pseudomonadota bacterium]
MSVEPIRRAQLVEATIHEIGETGSLNVTVSKIAKRAGVSSALAFHYFGDKEQLFLASMRYILAVYGAEVRGALRAAQTPKDRVTGIIRSSFSPANFRQDVIAAWLNFYVLALTSPEAGRLLRVYHRRLHSNLVYALRQLVGDDAAPDVAKRISGLIDGLYLHYALNPSDSDGEHAEARVLTSLENEIAAYADAH